MPREELPETRERRCPVCQSETIAPMGHVEAVDGLIKAQYQCEACGAAFFIVRKPIS
jgi:DNA-directed RNA polymerase subunit RPC12/RpoP